MRLIDSLLLAFLAATAVSLSCGCAADAAEWAIESSSGIIVETGDRSGFYYNFRGERHPWGKHERFDGDRHFRDRHDRHFYGYDHRRLVPRHHHRHDGYLFPYRHDRGYGSPHVSFCYRSGSVLVCFGG